ncbi:DUF4129 domain-containing protein [uncultured Bacteroides sp.]|uniref:DUF4129 domain-containing protein n=1 Tax=uncultured Bacteroides sp. TaxID=162156 RepID=UPI0037485C64
MRMEQMADTLICDVGRIKMWQSLPAYDYNRDLVTPDLNLFQLLIGWIKDFLGGLFGDAVASKYSLIVFAALLLIVFALLAWYLYRRHSDLFVRPSKKVTSYTEGVDTIYGVNFEAEIEAALLKNDFKEAIRLCYLQMLKHLADEGRINWQLYKTPTEYIYEIKKEEQRFLFRKFTNRFLRVRYGNFEVTESQYREVEVLQQEMLKGGWDEE